jgi:hypothetical protein
MFFCQRGFLPLTRQHGRLTYAAALWLEFYYRVQNIKSWSAGFPARLISILQAGMPAFQYFFTLQNHFSTMEKSLLQGAKSFFHYGEVIIAMCEMIFPQWRSRYCKVQNGFSIMEKSSLQPAKSFFHYGKVIIARCKIVFPFC